LIFSHCKRTGSIRNFKRGAADKAGGLHGPNVRVERRLADGAAGGKVSARTRGWAPAMLWRSDLWAAASSPPRLTTALCQHGSLQTTPASSDWGEACFRSMNAKLCRRDLWPLQCSNRSNTGRQLHAARRTPARVKPLGHSPTFARTSAHAIAAELRHSLGTHNLRQTSTSRLLGPNVRHERRLAGGAAGGKTSARWRG
jgi:hypothetical protein